MFGFAASRGVMYIRQSGPGSAMLGVLLAAPSVSALLLVLVLAPLAVGQGGAVEDLALLA
jgi:hypothetical protein